METTGQLLRRLLGRRVPARVHVRAGSAEAGFHVVLLKEGDHQGDRGVWAEVAQADNLDFERLIKSSTPLLVKAQEGPRELSFVSSLVAQRKPLLGGFRVLLAWPGVIKVQERRRSPREAIPPSAPISIILLRAADGAYPPANVGAKAVDVSIHGACLICPGCVSLQPELGRSVQIQMRIDGIEHRIGARYRGIENLLTGHLRLRVEFDCDAIPAATASRLQAFVEKLRSQRAVKELNCAIAGGVG